MTDSMHAEFEAWLDEPHPAESKLTRRDYMPQHDGGFSAMVWQAATLKATLAERERCALVCESLADHGEFIKDARYEKACDDCMSAIRLPLPPTGTEGTHG